MMERESKRVQSQGRKQIRGLAMVFLGTLGFSRSSSGDHFKHRIPQKRAKGQKISEITEEKSDLGAVRHLECSLASQFSHLQRQNQTTSSHEPKEPTEHHLYKGFLGHLKNKILKATDWDKSLGDIKKLLGALHN